jgi:hypothetical protein
MEVIPAQGHAARAQTCKIFSWGGEHGKSVASVIEEENTAAPRCA